MVTSITRLTAWLALLVADARTRARDEAEQGEIVEKVIIVAAAAAIAIAAMAAIALAVDIKVGSIQL
ncbi:MAG: hypothetical protein AB7H92_18310 [Microbacteriaceae bacterium]